MMKKQMRSKSGVFLIELLLAIGIFSVCAAICVHLLSVAQTEQRYSENLNSAINIASYCADSFKGGYDLEKIKKELPIEAEAFDCSFALSDENGTQVLEIRISDNTYEYVCIKAAKKGESNG